MTGAPLIHVVNPNTTAAMTAKIATAAQAVASPGTRIEATQPADGPPSIEGYYDEAYAVPGMLARIREMDARGASAHVIACFDDTGLDAARCIASAPVIGIGEAAFHIASLIAHRFSVVTTLSRSIAPIEHNLHRYGLAARCARVRAANVSVLSLEDANSPARAEIVAQIVAAKRDDGADAIVLGCAGMADLAADLAREHGLPVVDGVAAAVALAEALARLGLRTSRAGPYALPVAKTFAGAFADASPGNRGD